MAVRTIAVLLLLVVSAAFLSTMKCPHVGLPAGRQSHTTMPPATARRPLQPPPPLLPSRQRKLRAMGPRYRGPGRRECPFKPCRWRRSPVPSLSRGT